jgi:hypothetical protein
MYALYAHGRLITKRADFQDCAFAAMNLGMAQSEGDSFKMCDGCEIKLEVVLQ